MGAHALEGRLEPDKLRSFEIAARYQMYHALALVLCGLLGYVKPDNVVQIAAAGFLVGAFLFSGGLYAWVFTGQRVFAHIVPFGGLVWIIAWLLLAAGALRR